MRLCLLKQTDTMDDCAYPVTSLRREMWFCVLQETTHQAYLVEACVHQLDQFQRILTRVNFHGPDSLHNLHTQVEWVLEEKGNCSVPSYIESITEA